MNKQKLVEKYEGELPSIGMNISNTIKFKELWDDILELDEPEKVVVPQFVADWIEKYKAKRKSLLGALLYTPEGVNSWVGNSENQETFALAWIFGYEVEKEKRYLVKVKGVCRNHETLNCEKHSNEWLFSSSEENCTYKTKFTRKELEEADFGWVFDCPGIEVVEVE